ncbi:MAG: hypothetical protein EKK37_10035 [Sphingobacteriales bacterium]|nr:MAG: hypothetical protein EKK37_10035 [Sphingobacteriales bacterium]
MSQNQQTTTRPPLITLLCTFVFAAGIYMIIQTFSGAFQHDLKDSGKILFSPLIVLFIIIALTGASGIWTMEKWGFFIFLIAACGFQVVPAIFGVWTYAWLLPVVLSSLFAIHLREMKS